MNLKDRSKEFRSFVNVIEDARIDKLIQKKYPGLTKDYLLGFKKMYKDNFFGTKGKDLQKDYTLIDKINMYYKSSKTLDFDFNKKEQHFVKLVDDCKTFADVQKLAEDILGYCKEELKKTPQLKKTYTPKKVEGDDKQKGDNQDSDSDNSSDSNDNKSTEDKLNDFLEQQVPDEKTTKETDKKDSEESENKTMMRQFKNKLTAMLQVGHMLNYQKLILKI
jgi:cobalamin biosynthesis protein CobT